jgi:WD40 repeat protein
MSIKQKRTARFEYEGEIKRLTEYFTGRQWVFDAIDKWLIQSDAPRFFIITGEPGIGKSAIAAQLSKNSNVAAIHFCRTRQADTIDPLNFIKGVSIQLTRISGFSEQLLNHESINLNIDVKISKNYGQVVGATINTLILQSRSALEGFNRAIVDPISNLYENGFDQYLLIVVDALDEAGMWKGNENIIELIASSDGLPEKVKFILTTRMEDDVLRNFRERRVPFLLLDAHSKNNFEDVETYLANRISLSQTIKNLLTTHSITLKEFIENAKSASKGNFLYLVLLLSDLEKNDLQIINLDALPSGLNGIYREFLRNRTIGKNLDYWRNQYRPIFGLLIVAQAPLNFNQLTSITSSKPQKLKDILEDIEQFLNPILFVKGQFQLYHQSIIDFLSNKKDAEEFWIDTNQYHEEMVDYCEKSWGAGNEEYCLRYLPRHMILANLREKYLKLLLNFRWLKIKLDKLGTRELMADFAFDNKDLSLNLLKETLDLDSFYLGAGENRLIAQLFGRLSRFNVPEINNLLHQAEDIVTDTWLRSLVPSLTPPHGRLIRTIGVHPYGISAMKVSKKGDKAITLGQGLPNIFEWNFNSMKVSLRRANALFNTVQFMPNEQIAFFAGGIPGLDDSVFIEIWDAENKKVLHKLVEHTDNINNILVTSDSKYLVSSSKDCTIKLWDLKTRKPVYTVKLDNGVNCIVLSPNGRQIISGGGRYEEKFAPKISFFRLKDGKEEMVLIGHAERILSMTISSDGKTLFSGSADRTLRVWDVEKGKQIKSIDCNGSVIALGLIPGTNKIIVGCTFGLLEVWDWEKNKLLTRLEGHTLDITSIWINPEGTRALTSSWDETIKEWRLDGDLSISTESPSPHSTEVTTITVSSNGKMAASASRDGKIVIWDTYSGNVLQILESHLDQVNFMKFSVDSKYLISGGGALSTASDNVIRVWDLENFSVKQILEGHTERVTGLDVSSNGKEIISSSADGKVIVWNIERGSGEILCQLDSNIAAIAFSSDRNIVCIAEEPDLSSDEFTQDVFREENFPIRLWNLANRKEINILSGHKSTVNALAITYDNELLLSVSNEKLMIWDIRFGRLIIDVELDCIYDKVAIDSGNTKAIFYGGTYANITVLDLMAKTRSLTKLKLKMNEINQIVILPDGQQILIISGNHNLQLHNLESGVVCSFIGDSPLTSCAIVPDGSIVIVGEESGKVHFLRIENPTKCQIPLSRINEP